MSFKSKNNENNYQTRVKEVIEKKQFLLGYNVKRIQAETNLIKETDASLSALLEYECTDEYEEAALKERLQDLYKVRFFRRDVIKQLENEIEDFKKEIDDLKAGKQWLPVEG